MKCEKCGEQISEYEFFGERYCLHMIINHGDSVTDEWLDKNKEWFTGKTALKASQGSLIGGMND